MNNLKTYLTEAYAVDKLSILRILTQSRQINKNDKNYSYYDKLAIWANSSGRQQKLKNIDLNTIQLSDKSLITKNKLITKHTTLGHLLLALKNLMDQEGRYNPDSELSNLIQQTTLEILAGLSGLKNTAPAPEKEKEPEEEEPEDDDNYEPEADEPSGGKKDWTAYRAEKLANAKGNASEALNEFYAEYYSQEYAGVDSPEKDTKGIVAKLKSLDKILIPEFNALGYNPEVNPFAQFLKILIRLSEKGSTIFSRLTTNNYGAIHNSFINGTITGNMLGNYSKDNILFCSDLYNQNGLDIVEYLSLQKQTNKSAENDVKYSNISRFVARVFVKQKTFKDTYKENIEGLLDASEDEITTIVDSGAKLKSLLEIRELYKYLFKTSAKKSIDINKIVKDATDQNAALDIIRHIIDQDEFEKAFSSEATAAEEWLKEQQYERTDQGSKAGRKILSEYTVNVRVAKTLITKLQAAYLNSKKVKDNS